MINSTASVELTEREQSKARIWLRFNFHSKQAFLERPSQEQRVGYTKNYRLVNLKFGVVTIEAPNNLRVTSYKNTLIRLPQR